MRRDLAQIGLIVASVLASFSSFSQDIRTALNFSVIYDDVITKALPSYIEGPGDDYKIATEGVYNKTNPALSIELGYHIERGCHEERFSIYTGLFVALRRLDIIYVDENTYAMSTSNGEPEEVYLQAKVKRDLIMVQVPIGVKFPVGQKFAFGTSVRNNFVVAEISNERANNPGFTYKIDPLNKRSPTQYLPEVSAEASYRIGRRGSLSLKYIYGLRSIYPEVKNVYDQLITSKMNFSSIMLSYNLAINNNLFSRDKER